MKDNPLAQSIASDTTNNPLTTSAEQIQKRLNQMFALGLDQEYRDEGNNCKIIIDDDQVLHITIDLKNYVGLTSDERRYLIATTRGNLRLSDSNGVRDETINMNLTRPIPGRYKPKTRVVNRSY